MRGPLLVTALAFPLTVSLAVALTAPLAGCLQLSTDGTDGGTATTSTGTGTGTATSTSSSGGGATSGSGCTTDPQSGITLCEEIANCPGIDVDQGVYPGCGFRMHGGSIYDLECGCGDSLCPIGVPTSCTTALQLLEQNQSSIVVCEQLDNGSCLALGADAGAASSSSSSCDKQCASECGGNPDCYQLCGC